MKSLEVLMAAAAIIMLELLSAAGLEARTSLTVQTLVPTASIPGVTDLLSDIENRTDLNGRYVSNSFALANITGYPVGKAHIGRFPSFEGGIAVGGGLTNAAYFDHSSYAHENGSLPGVSLNPVLRLGVGLTDRIDVFIKAFFMNTKLIKQDVGTSLAKLSYASMTAEGIKLRYNIVKPQTIVPLLFGFGGITLSLGVDSLYGQIKVHGRYDTSFKNILVDYGTGSVPLTLDFDGDYGGKVAYGMLSLTAQACAYVDLLYLFSVYTGFGITGGYGKCKVNFDGTGQLTTTDLTYIGTFSTPVVGQLIFSSSNTYYPYVAIPAYIVGIEINILVLKITGETMLNLYNLKDVNAQIGVRVQI